jgi:hypothetical protein
MYKPDVAQTSAPHKMYKPDVAQTSAHHKKYKPDYKITLRDSRFLRR